MGARERSILLARLSDKRPDQDELDLTEDGIAPGLDDQIRQMRAHAARLDWDVWKILMNPRLSAYKRRLVTLPDGRREYRVYRPDLREALDDLWAGRATRLLCLDLDRAFRDPKDLQDLIDVVEHAPHDIVVESVTGSLHMERGYDNFDAEVRVLVANKSSRDTARRVARARLRQARNGQFGGGQRPFGFCEGPPPVRPGDVAEERVCGWHGGRDCRAGITTIEAETEVIAECSRRLVLGVSLREMAADLRAGDVGTVTGAPWSASTLRDILLRPRNAGLMVYRGEVLEGVSAPWEPIITPEEFEAVKRLLTDPARRKGPGAAPRWLGSGIFRCGLCTPPGTDPDRPVTMQVTMGQRDPRYRCKEKAHLTRNVAHADHRVLAYLAAVLTHPNAAELLAPIDRPDVDATALQGERKAIRERLEQMAEDEVLGLKTRAQVIAATRRGNARIAEIDEMLNASVTRDPLAELLNEADPVAALLNSPVSHQRVIVNRLCTVTILPNTRRGKGFDPASVRIDPKHSLDMRPRAVG